jgi:hypothetical protein
MAMNKYQVRGASFDNAGTLYATVEAATWQEAERIARANISGDISVRRVQFGATFAELQTSLNGPE